MDQRSHDDRNDPPMHRRRTTMVDGRTMYYYTFGDETNDAPAVEAGEEDRDV